VLPVSARQFSPDFVKKAECCISAPQEDRDAQKSNGETTTNNTERRVGEGVSTAVKAFFNGATKVGERQSDDGLEVMQEHIRPGQAKPLEKPLATPYQLIYDSESDEHNSPVLGSDNGNIPTKGQTPTVPDSHNRTSSIFTGDATANIKRLLPSTSHTPETLPCPIGGCGTCFEGQYRRGNLSRHIRTKHGVGTDVVHMCRVKTCAKTFKRSDALRKHEWKQHPELDVPHPKMRK
jgi:hypothetical protein